MTENNYVCGHCGYEGPCYGAPHGGDGGVSAPWCTKCKRNDKLMIPIKLKRRPFLRRFLNAYKIQRRYLGRWASLKFAWSINTWSVRK